MRRKYRRRSVFPLALAALLLLSGAAGGLYYHQMGPRKQALFERAAYYREPVSYTHLDVYKRQPCW